MSFKEGGWILVLVGTVFGLIGLGVVWAGVSTRAQVNELEAQPVWQMSDLQTSSVGQSGVFEANVSENNHLLFRGFVAYWQDVYEGEDCSRDDDGNTDCTSIWSQRSRETPSVWLDVPPGRVQITNTDYELVYPTTWQSTEQLIAFQTERYSGLEVGNEVFVKGVVLSAGETPTLQAGFIAGVNRADYLAGERRSAWGSVIFGCIFALVGGGLGGGWILSRML